MAKINSVDNRSSQLTIDPGSGDSFVQLSINETEEFTIGVDDTDSDAFVISQGATIGTNNTFRMSSAGERTMPLQPAFLVANSSHDLNVTGDSTVVTVDFESEIFDQGANFAADTFTAPVTGKYKFTIMLFPFDGDSSHADTEFKLVTSNRTYLLQKVDFWGIAYQTDGKLATCNDVLVDMDSSDTAYATITISGGTKTVDIWGSGTSQLRTGISGVLCC